MNRHTIDPTLTFDIETEDWDRFVLGAVHEVRTRETWTFTHRHEADMIARILSFSGNAYAHFGGRFDFLWFLDAARRYGALDNAYVELIESGSRIIIARIQREGMDDLILRDSHAMFPLRLAQIGGKDEVGLTCDGSRHECRELIRVQTALSRPVKGCGGYCQIRRNMSRADRDRVMAYCVQDCVALAEGLTGLISFARDTAKVDLAATTGATAWKTAMSRGLIGPTPHTPRTWDRVRQAYFGGRVIVRESYAPIVHRYDITSSYPHQCSQPLPDGPPIVLPSPREARAAFRKARPGIYEGEVTVPPMDIPPLPARATVRGAIRNVFPTGKFHGSWALPEIEYAESLGCSFVPTGAVVFPEERIIFADMMAEMIGLRLKVGKDSREGAILKLWANSLYGKFAQRPPESHLAMAGPHMVPEGSIPVEGADMVWRIPLKRSAPIPKSSHIEKAAYITARARIQQHKMMIFGFGGTVYGDTDSVYCRSERPAASGLGAGLGAWVYEGSATDFQARAPKLYRMTTDKGPKIRGKGLPIPSLLDRQAADAFWNRVEHGAPLRFAAGVESFRAAIRKRGPIFMRREMERRTSTEIDFGDRIHIPGTTLSRPPDARELTLARLPFDYKE